jgi:hypothetical protein
MAGALHAHPIDLRCGNAGGAFLQFRMGAPPPAISRAKTRDGGRRCKGISSHYAIFLVDVEYRYMR